MSQENGHVEPWNKGRRLPPEPLSVDEMTRLIKQPSRRAPTGIRNRALLVLLYRGGLRCSEALALRPKDLDVDAGTVRVLHGKGDKARLVGLDSGAMAIIQVWVDKRASLGFNGRQRLICTLKGKPVSSRYVRGLLPRLAAKAGIEKRGPRTWPAPYARERVGRRGHARASDSTAVGPQQFGHDRSLHPSTGASGGRRRDAETSVESVAATPPANIRRLGRSLLGSCPGHHRSGRGRSVKHSTTRGPNRWKPRRWKPTRAPRPTVATA